jgi:hypothetical protein
VIIIQINYLLDINNLQNDSDVERSNHRRPERRPPTVRKRSERKPRDGREIFRIQSNEPEYEKHVRNRKDSLGMLIIYNAVKNRSKIHATKQ